MSSREDMFKKKIALQDSIRAEADPKKKKVMQKRFDAMRIPIAEPVTHGEKVKARDNKLRTAIQAIKDRNAVLDSLKKMK